jgi:DNA polymerase III subunit delta
LMDSQQLYSSVEKSLESGKYAPIYFFFGDEPYLVGQAVNYLKTCALHGGAADFNFNSYYAADADITMVRDEVETLPMMSSRRVVLLKEVQDLTESEWTQLEPIISQPVDSTVFIMAGSKIDKRKKFFKSVIEQAVTVEFKKPFDNQIPGWIRHICKGHNLSISDDALQLMHRLVGSPLAEIESEVLKLKDFIGERTSIELEDVASCVSKTREENVFDLTESIALGDRVQALTQLVQLLDQGQHPTGIVALVARHTRILLMIKQGQDQGLTNAKLASFAQVPPYYLQDYVNQAKAWTVKRLESCLLALSETDRALKSSPLSAHIWLENLVLRVCSPQKPSASAYGQNKTLA